LSAFKPACVVAARAIHITITMKPFSFNRLGLLAFVAAALSLGGLVERPAWGQQCPITLPASPGNNLSADITAYPYYNSSLGVQQQLPALFMVDVTTDASGSYPPIPYGLYPAWCVDQWNDINPTQASVPGNLYIGALYSTCDPILNTELPPGHNGTYVSPTNWLMVNYILNNQTYNGTNAFYWDVQAALNTLVGSAVGSYNLYAQATITTPVPSGPYPGTTYPTYDPVVVQALLTAATNAVMNTPPWTPQCGDVYGVIYATAPNATDPSTTPQFLLLEVPVPCTESLSVSKQIACSQGVDNCGIFGKTEGGYVGTNDPAFCYQITILNTGTIPLTNFTVTDNLLGTLTSPATSYFSNFLAPGSSSTACFQMAFSANATNTVTVTGENALTNAVTNVTTTATNIIYPLTPVTATDQAVALVDAAGIACSLSVTSPQDLNSNSIAGSVLLSSSSSTPPTVTLAITLANTGRASLQNVTVASSALTGLHITMPAPFNLSPGQSTNCVLYTGTAGVFCPSLTFSVNVGGQAAADSAHCGVYDSKGNPIGVSCSSLGSVSNTASISGNVYLSCQNGQAPAATSPALNGVTVSLVSNSVVLNFIKTDASGHYSFGNLLAGNYSVQVTPPASYSLIYTGPSPLAIPLIGCGNVTQNFGLEDNTLITLSVPAGKNYGCNPGAASLATVTSISNGVTATDDRGPVSYTVTLLATTKGCLVQDVFTIIATGFCGQTVTAYVTNTWTVETTPPVISGLPKGGSLGLNPAGLPTIASISNYSTLLITDACGEKPSYTVTAAGITNACAATCTFTIIATDACLNSVTQQVTYTWTYDSGPTVTCPPNVTIATNFCPIYCTFTCSDWCSSCNPSGTPPTWWINWDQQNHGYNCQLSWQSWWTSCTGNNPGTSFWNFCQNQQSGDNGSHWWGGSCNQSSAPGWCASYNFGNPNNNWWVPCNGNNPGSVLNNSFGTVYSGGFVQIGLPNGNSVKLTSCNAVRQCLGFSGAPGVLNGSAVNPNSCGAGSFCAQVLALQLNCDIGDAGANSGFGGPCGDLVLNDATSPCNGQKVRDILKTANCVLGGGAAPAGCTVSYLCGLCGNLNQCFEGCQVSSWCKNHLVPVCVPPPSVTGTATVKAGDCSSNVVLTHCDSTAAGNCPGSYVITRTWTAVDAAGLTNSCVQFITITPFPGPSISGTVVNDGVGAGCSSGKSTPNFSGDAGLAGVAVTLKNSSGKTLATTTTDTNGDFTFANPGAGSYTVVVTPPAGYLLTYPTTGTANQASVTISGACQAVTNLIFAYMGNQTGVKIVKTGPATAACGDSITYSFAVTNTGNNCVTLAVIDPLLGGQVFSQNSVAPGQGFAFTQTYIVRASSIGQNLTNIAWGVAKPASGSSVSNSSTVLTAVSTKIVKCSLYSSFNSQSPGNGWIWCNAHISANPNQSCDIHCQGATITITGNSGKTYTYPVPDCDIVFASNCKTAASTFNGTQWNTTLPTAGDDGIFLAGCAIPYNPDFAGAHTVCWSGNFSCNVTGTSFNWQWGAACYNNNLPQYGSLGVKACHETSCGYNNGDQAGTPENQKPSCVGGGTGGGGSNCTGSWSSTGSCTFQPCY
jgi:uncharacterized repeat protein (TIGR01451 family)